MIRDAAFVGWLSEEPADPLRTGRHPERDSAIAGLSRLGERFCGRGAPFAAAALQVPHMIIPVAAAIISNVCSTRPHHAPTDLGHRALLIDLMRSTPRMPILNDRVCHPVLIWRQRVAL